MNVLNSLVPLLLVVLSATPIVSAGVPLTVINPTFANVPVDCAGGFSYQSVNGGNCTSQYPEQLFNGVPGIGWDFSYVYNTVTGSGAGLTGPNTAFDPPSFTGLPFTQAAFLQNANSEVSQTIPGFVAGQPYRLAFYLGSRQVTAPGCCNGNQTVVAYLDDHVLGVWSLVSNTPFILRYALLKVAGGGPHLLRFVGTATGDHTAFLSGVSIEAVAAER